MKKGQLHEAVDSLKGIIERFPDFDRAYGKLIEVHRTLGSSDEARAYFESLLTRAPELPYPLYGLGLMDRQRGDTETAANRFEACLERAAGFAPLYAELLSGDVERPRSDRIASKITRFLQEDPENAGALYGMSLIEKNRRDWDKMAQHLTEALRLKPDLWEAQVELFLLQFRLSQFEKAVRLLDDAHESLRARGDLERAGWALSRTSDIYRATQDYPRTMSYLSQSVQISREIGDERLKLRSLARVGMVHALLGRHRLALEAYAEALDASRVVGDRGAEGRNLGLIADAHVELANYAEAIASYSEAVSLARQVGDRNSEAYQLASLGSVYTALGEHDKALEHIESALRVARAQDRRLEQDLLFSLGLVYLKKGEFSKALEAYTESARVAQGLGDRKAEASRHGYMGNVYARLGKTTEALNHYQEGLALAREIGTVGVEAEIANDLGALHLKLGEVNRAFELHTRALSIGETTRISPIVWQAHAGLAAIDERRGATIEALGHYRRAIESVEAVRGKLDMADEKATFFQDKIDVYRKVVDLLVTLDEKDPNQGYAREAFHYSERARSRALLDLLAEARLNVDAGIAPELLDQQREGGARLSEIQTRLLEAYSRKAAPDQLKALEVELARADDDYLSVKREIRRRFPRYAELQYPEPARLDEVQKLLSDRSLLLEYFVGEPSSFLFAVRNNSFRVVRLPSAPRFQEEVAKLRNAVSRPDRATFSTYASQARRLYQDLIQPAQDLLLGADEIVVAADGVLHYLPFELLLRERPGSPLGSDPSRLPYVIRDYRVSYIPAAGLLGTLRARVAGTPTKALLALGDPSYGGDVPSDKDKSPQVARRGSFERDRPWMFRRLQHSRDEVMRIARLYPRDQVDVLVGAEATEENLKAEGKLGQYRVIHFATHGLLNESRPQFSGLVLSLPQTARLPEVRRDSVSGGGSSGLLVRSEGSTAPAHTSEDGLLQVYEIFNMKLNADLVVLSACETGLGKEIRGEGLLGLTRAFMYAGTPAVVVSLWKVADASTADLMVRFYEYLREGKLSRSEALRRAQLDILGKSGLAHPYYWAPFVLVGAP